MLGRIKDKIKHYYLTIINIPNFIKNKILGFKNYLNNCKYKMNHLSETNYELGLDHLYRGNLNDALLRFKLVDKFFNPNDSKTYYQLGWTYFLKNDYPKAIEYLEKSNEKYKTIFIDFLKNYKNAIEVPQEIWGKYRDLTAKYYTNIFNNDKNIHLPYRFVNETIKQITDLPDNYSILELGSNIGLVGYEAEKRFPESFTLTGVEISSLMNDLEEAYHNNLKIYDQIYDISINKFLKQNSNKFDIILSFCGLSFTKDLSTYFNLIYSSLNKLGYFALCVPTTSANTQFSVKRKEFIFNLNEINTILQNNNFTVLASEEIILAENNKYSIIICKKTDNKL